MIFAAKEAVEKKAQEKERRRILNLLERHGVELPPDVVNDLNRNGSRRS